MRIGVFLDVDKTLTRNFIEDEFSRALGCFDECHALEEAFARQEISWAALNQQIAGIFAGRNFTRTRARELFEVVSLQPWTEQLLKLPGVDIYLVSTGPSYYIDTLAKRYGIPLKRVLRSEYRFNASSGLLETCDMVNDQQKATFVSERAARYDISIGIGDSPQSDGPFVSHCTIPLLTVPTADYIYIPDLNSAILLIQRISKMQTRAGRLAKDLDFENITAQQLLRLPIRYWLTLGTGATVAFGLGMQVAKLIH